MGRALRDLHGVAWEQNTVDAKPALLILWDVLVILHVERMALKGVNFRDLQRGDKFRLPFVGERQFEVLRDLRLIRLILGGLLGGRSGGLILGGGVLTSYISFYILFWFKSDIWQKAFKHNQMK